ncbi:nucleoside 2-deoxyribosyltransferase [Zavarzinia sp. CC-PAN008]|uniref:nucleoside 2-deoxyribosyltransferase n=1 Tax=Zavarzinia sp. CC-PAN008 TaxID=3243332 RepID=UPI003F74744D
MRKVYLAGPEVFWPDAGAIGQAKRALCAEAGWVGLFPLDNDLAVDGLAPQAVAQAIFDANIAMIARADAVIANLSPFRGPGADPGTVFEVGFAHALGKPVFGYSVEGGSLLDRTRARLPLTRAASEMRDPDGALVEDFGLAENLMIACALAAPMVLPQAGDAADLRGLGLFRRCLALLGLP